MSTPPDNDEPFLSRWSRRKRGVEPHQETSALQAGQPVAQPHAPVVPQQLGEGAAAGDVKAEDELDLTTLPRVEDLDATSDITAFLDKRVPAFLRNAALGRMWTLDPTIRDFIEVAENQWNWNIPGGAPFHEPLEGGAEIAESIVRGLTSAAREAAEAVTAHGTDATLVEGGEVEPAVSLASQGSDRATQGHVAAQEDRPAGDVEPVDSALKETKANQAYLLLAEENVAAHTQGTEMDPQFAPRRRHGGALPV